MKQLNTYWNGNGTYEAHANYLTGFIPHAGECQMQNDNLNTPLEVVRCINNIYYDVYNNGGCNLYESEHADKMAQYVEDNTKDYVWLKESDGKNLSYFLVNTNWDGAKEGGRNLMRLERIVDVIIRESYIRVRKECFETAPLFKEEKRSLKSALGEYVHLESVGCLYDKQHRVSYALLENGMPDIDSGVLVDECSDEWHNALSDEDYKLIHNE